MTSEILTQNYLKSILRYDPETGYLYWRVDRANGQIKAGDRAGCLVPKGYIVLGIERKVYFAHRLIWKMVTGNFPREHIDHINHIRHDNRIENLRAANYSVNGQNQSMHPTNTSGYTGVQWRKNRSKWIALMTVNGKRVCLGHFSDIEQAAAAIDAGKARYGFHPNHGK